MYQNINIRTNHLRWRNSTAVHIKKINQTDSKIAFQIAAKIALPLRFP